MPSPRDLTEFAEATAKIHCDKLWYKYYPQTDAYVFGRIWFLRHPEYTHFVILPDDLIITEDNFTTLKEDAEKYDVVSGWCRNTIRLMENWVGEPETEDDAASNISTTTLPPDPPNSGTYDKYNFESLKTIQSLLDSGQRFVKVKFSGFVLPFIPRKVLELIPFRSSYGCCVDSCFSLDLYHNKIDQYCDLQVRTVHINASDLHYLEVGKKEAEVIFEKG